MDKWKQLAASKENRWYYASLENRIPPSSRKLLEEYSDVPAEDVDNHVYRLRDVLWEYGPYPCVGEFKFLTLNLPSHPLYDKVLALLQAGKKDDEGTQKKKNNFLDLGCCVAQELRSLAHAGIPSSQLYGADLNHKFLETSYSLFRDEGRFEGKLVAADIFAPNLLNEGGAMEGWNAKFTIVHAGLFLHLFNWEQQVDVCTTIISLLSPLLGAIFLGEMVGCAGGRECGPGPNSPFFKMERKQFLHDEHTFAKLWNEAAARSGTEGKWRVKGELKIREHGVDPTGGCAYFVGEGIGWFTFIAERVEV